MIFEDQFFAKSLFHGLNDYKKYIKKNSLDKILDVNLKYYNNVRDKQIKHHYYSLDQNNTVAFPAELDDLTRLHYLIISRKVMTILEFGIGKSTIIFNDALIKNEKKYKTFVSKNLRKINLFECHSLDNQQIWIKKLRSEHNFANVKFHHEYLEMGTFNDRVCTFYKKIPNINPDFIYLDGPDQFFAKGFIRGVNTNNSDKFPMAGDILIVEHFLHPGTLIVVDGRTANARFLKTNLQRDWIYYHDKNKDQHFFELSEDPLGPYNKKKIDFCLGDKFYVRLKKSNLCKKLFQSIK